MPCTPLKVNRCFGGTYRLHLQGRIRRARYQRERWQGEWLPPAFALVNKTCNRRCQPVSQLISNWQALVVLHPCPIRHFVVLVIRHGETFTSNISCAGRGWARILSVIWLWAWQPILHYQQDSLSSHVQTGRGVHCVFYPMVNWRSYPEFKAAEARISPLALIQCRCYKRIKIR
jgi:hypothetical protein